MRSTYRVLALTVAVGVVLQAAFIAFGFFDVLSTVDDGQIYDGEYNAGQVLHAMGGYLTLLVSLILLIVSFFAKIAGGVKWAAIVFGVALLQVLLAFGAFGLPVIGLLHGLNAFALAGVASLAAKQASTATSAAAPQRSRTPA